MEYFVEKKSIVREIWGKGDTILFIFAGAAAEFALNKAVDWLYFTGKLPADPLARLFSTVTYARKIVFSKSTDALKAIDKITAIHSNVEKSRNASIPDWAYRDVLFMLIHYSIASYELLERKLDENEKEDVFDVFYRFGIQMNLQGLPQNYQQWKIMRKDHLDHDLKKSWFTIDLYKQYKKHLGLIRYKTLLQSQSLVLPKEAKEFLALPKFNILKLILPVYKKLRDYKIGLGLKYTLLPVKYRKEIFELDKTL